MASKNKSKDGSKLTGLAKAKSVGGKAYAYGQSKPAGSKSASPENKTSTLADKVKALTNKVLGRK